MSDIWLVGVGPMAIDYAKVLKALSTPFISIGRSKEGVDVFKEATGIDAKVGGLQNFLETTPSIPKCAVVAVSIENLAESCIMLLKYGVKKILLEKPGVGYSDEIIALREIANEAGANIVLAYNRRFYTSVMEAKKRIEEDGGVSSFHFEFTEWSHQIRNLNKHKIELENWFLGNSSHVVDTAFYLCGKPKEISCYHSGGNDWHPKATIYSGAGVSESSALFSYEANWEAPGRWNIDIMTRKHRYVFKPMEKLQIQEIGSVAISIVEGIDYSYDETFKPGLYKQVYAFLNGNFENFCTINEQAENMILYKKMSGY